MYAGDYAKDSKQAGSKQGGMLRFIHKASAVPSCPSSSCDFAASPQSTESQSKSRMPVFSQDSPAGLGRSSTVHNKRSAEHVILTMQQQRQVAQRPDAAKSNQFKLPRQGIGPMDRFLK